MGNQYYWGYEEREEGEPLRLAFLPISVTALEHAYFIPSGYKVVGLYYDEYKRVLNLMVTSEALPPVEEGQVLPVLRLHVTVETLDDHPGFRRYTPEIKPL